MPAPSAAIVTLSSPPLPSTSRALSELAAHSTAAWPLVQPDSLPDAIPALSLTE